MPLFNPADLDFHGEEIKALSQAVFVSGFSKPELSLFHDVVQNIKVKTQVAILGQLTGPVGVGSGECNPTASDNGIATVQKFWDPEPVSDRIEECWTGLENTFWEWGLKNGVDKYDLTGTDFFNYVQEILEDAIWEAIYRLAWFGDKTADEEPVGVLKIGTDLRLFNKIDGLWKQLFAIAAADPDRLTAGLDVRNGQATYALQAFDSTDTTAMTVSNTLDNMMYEADERLEGSDDLIYIVTRTVANQYSRELKKATINFTTDRLENGIMKLTVDGVELYSFKLWDRIIKAYFDDGTKYYLPHRAVLTTKTNMKVATEQASELAKLDVFYDRYRKVSVIDFMFTLDAMVGLDHMVQLAY